MFRHCDIVLDQDTTRNTEQLKKKTEKYDKQNLGTNFLPYIVNFGS